MLRVTVEVTVAAFTIATEVARRIGNESFILLVASQGKQKLSQYPLRRPPSFIWCSPNMG